LFSNWSKKVKNKLLTFDQTVVYCVQNKRLKKVKVKIELIFWKGEMQVGISDLIASFLQESLDEAENGVVEVQRNDLAQRFNCVPSQINYVMSTRFSPERGYIVESRRGGNGYIRITRVQVDRQTLMMHVINSIGERMDLPSARAILSNLVQSGALEEPLGRSILAAVGDKALAAVPRETRDTVRADILRNVLILQV
jgi:transcriptional regulator CtsR